MRKLTWFLPAALVFVTAATADDKQATVSPKIVSLAVHPNSLVLEHGRDLRRVVVLGVTEAGTDCLEVRRKLARLSAKQTPPKNTRPRRIRPSLLSKSLLSRLLLRWFAAAVGFLDFELIEPVMLGTRPADS